MGSKKGIATVEDIRGAVAAQLVDEAVAVYNAGQLYVDPGSSEYLLAIEVEDSDEPEFLHTGIFQDRAKAEADLVARATAALDRRKASSSTEPIDSRTPEQIEADWEAARHGFLGALPGLPENYREMPIEDLRKAVDHLEALGRRDHPSEAPADPVGELLALVEILETAPKDHFPSDEAAPVDEKAEG